PERPADLPNRGHHRSLDAGDGDARWSEPDHILASRSNHFRWNEHGSDLRHAGRRRQDGNAIADRRRIGLSLRSGTSSAHPETNPLRPPSRSPSPADGWEFFLLGVTGSLEPGDPFCFLAKIA